MRDPGKLKSPVVCKKEQENQDVIFQNLIFRPAPNFAYPVEGLLLKTARRTSSEKLKTSEGKLPGIIRLNSSTAKKIAGMPVKVEGDKLQVDISEIPIEKIKIRNNTWSTILNIGVPVVTAFIGLMVVTLIDMSNDDWGGMDLEW